MGDQLLVRNACKSGDFFIQHRDGNAHAYSHGAAITEHAHPHHPLWIHLLEGPHDHEGSCGRERHAGLTPFSSRLVLGPGADDVPLCTPQEDSCPQAHSEIIRVIEKGAQLP